MKVKWKKIKRVLLIAFSLCMMLGFSVPSHAYTEAEIAQARAWLSAHGYSPDRSGAAAAYRDYLNGRFDEELGRTTTEATTENSTVNGNGSSENRNNSTEDENDSTEDGTTGEELPEILLNPFDEELLEELDETGEPNESGNGEEETDTSQVVAYNGETVADAGTDAVDDGTKDYETIKKEAEKKAQDMNVDSAQVQKEETNRAHKEILLVIGISVGLMAVVEILLYMKSVS